MRSTRQAASRIPTITFAQRAGLILSSIILLIGVAVGIGLWFTASIRTNVQALQEASQQAIQVSDLQLNWLSVIGILDTISVTRPSAETQQQLQAQLAELNDQLLEISAQPVGLMPETIAENAAIVEELAQSGQDMSALANEIYALVEENRWGTALQRRQTSMADLQTRLTENLSRLNQNLQRDVAAQVAEVQSLQNTARFYWTGLVLITILVIFGISRMAYNRIINPIRQLTDDVQRITQGDIKTIAPLPQGDEIGELSRAFALMTEWLNESYTTLERRVAERTLDLERRTTQIQVAAQVARDIAATRDLEALLNNAVDMIRERFGFYHAGIFLVDERHEFAVLRAATGEAGQEMLDRKHRLKVGETGLVGYTTQTGKPRIALDVGQDAVHFKNPLLPETHSEVTLPLSAGDQVIGALDVQSQESDAFDEQSIAILQVIADQLTIAIQNARLLSELQSNLRELETAYGLHDRQAWERFAGAREVIGYKYDGIETIPVQDAPGADQGLSYQSISSDARPLAIPLQVRGQIIGSLDAWAQDRQLSDDEIYLLTMISGRISQILESARLFEETQVRAAHEETINRLTASIARSLDVDSALQAAARELGNMPAVVEATVYLGSPAPEASADGPFLTRSMDGDSPTSQDQDGNGADPGAGDQGGDLP
jgi:nitrate/nitrite-specific signal transduction histidine kinase